MSCAEVVKTVQTLRSMGFSDEEINEMLEKNKVSEAERHGRWIYLGGVDAFECSVCGRQMVRNIFDYCPWCGAKMEGHFEEPEINPCRGCEDYDGKGGCISNGGCGAKMDEVTQDVDL